MAARVARQHQLQCVIKRAREIRDLDDSDGHEAAYLSTENLEAAIDPAEISPRPNFRKESVIPNMFDVVRGKSVGERSFGYIRIRSSPDSV